MLEWFFARGVVGDVGVGDEKEEKAKKTGGQKNAPSGGRSEVSAYGPIETIEFQPRIDCAKNIGGAMQMDNG